jgi:tetratricopeptide (TPR) repeat protein
MMARLGLALALGISGLTAAHAQPAAPETRMGVISFPNSGAPAAQEPFFRGVLALHNFWFEEAEEAFKKAQQIDPGFALAYWGEAMSYNHPLWAEQDLAAARATLQRLGRTPKERSARAGTEREKAYLEAVEVLYGEGDKLERDRAYAKAMGRLAERFPEDDEAKVLHALSLLGTVRPGDKGFSRQMRSAAILADVQQRNPRHPGAAHFTIHSFDDPEHAPLSLKAADLYAQIAPEAPHALHMPTHIYIQLGMWERVLASNEAAFGASVKWVERKGLSLAKQDFHSLEWGQYGALQLGQYAKALGMVPLVEEVAAKTGDARVQSYVTTLRARYVVESRRWEDLPLPDAPVAALTGARTTAVYGSRANQLLAAGLSAAYLGRHGKAEEAARRLTALAETRKASGGAYDAQPIQIMAAQVEGLSKFLKGDTEAGLEQLASAARLEQGLDPPNGPTYPIKPSHELYAEALLQAGRGREAQQVFETALARMPRRSLSLLGLARAATGNGDTETAAFAYGQLGTTWAAADPGRELDEVRGFRSSSRVAAKP